MMLEVPSGHCTYCGAVSRGRLSILHTVCWFISSRYWTQPALWTSMMEKLRAFASILLVPCASWDFLWCKQSIMDERAHCEHESAAR